MFVLARELFESVTPPEGTELGIGPTFEEVLEFVKSYVDRRVGTEGDSEKSDIGMYYWSRRAMDVMAT